MIYMFLSNNPSSEDINSSNLSCLVLVVTQEFTVLLLHLMTRAVDQGIHHT